MNKTGKWFIIKYIMEKVICHYRQEWIQMFQDISDFLKQNIKTYVRIEHVGSTAIPGMDGKPIIDIDIEILSESHFSSIKTELEKIGYFHNGDQGIKGREVFLRSGETQSVLDKIPHHLYVCPSNNPEYKRHIRFRDKLRTDKSLVEEYKKIKHEIIKEVGLYNRQGYVEMKANNYNAFFERVLGESFSDQV